jgi:hypothetical protein
VLIHGSDNYCFIPTYYTDHGFAVLPFPSNLFLCSSAGNSAILRFFHLPFNHEILFFKTILALNQVLQCCAITAEQLNTVLIDGSTINQQREWAAALGLHPEA